MIASFADRATEALYHTGSLRAARRVPPGLLKKVLARLDMLNAARELVDLRSPPGNRLEALGGDLDGLFTIRVNDQWRIVFRWQDGNAHGVRLTDYH